MGWLRTMGLGTRIILLTLAILTVVVVVNATVFVTGHRESAVDAMVQKAAAFTAVADETKNHVSNLQGKGAFDLQGLLADLEQVRKAGRSYTEAKIFETIPVVSGWTAALAASKREHIDFRISAHESRNKSNQTAPGSFEDKLLTQLEAQVKAGGAETIYAIDKQTNQIHYMRAIRLGESCMMCHGDPKTSKTGDGLDPVGFKMENWAVGSTHGSYHVVMPLSVVDAQVASFVGQGLLWTVPLVIGGVITFVMVLRRIFNRPVAALVERIKDIAEGEGDLTKRVDATRGDELGELGRWFNTFVQKVHDIVTEVAAAAREVASASTQIAASSEEMASGMAEQTKQAMQVASAVEEMSASIVDVAKQSVQAAQSADESGKVAAEGGQVVQATIEGMDAINKTVTQSSQSVQELGKRGAQIGQIIEVINDIADQTNLLALNAAIEAARAGEHGRGFAVVADEVRKLADRTTKATEEIAQSIQAVQTETAQAVEQMTGGTEQVKAGMAKAAQAGQSLRKIVDSAQHVTRVIQSIAAAAEEQSAASEEISRGMESISAVINESSEGASHAAQASTQLSAKAESLRVLVGHFKLAKTPKG
ncbi:MAG: methyl-accepting chemotaxis protein [Phycisphaeraceae bacterium]|nr:methyl-accepting chemotaxis protein [Phycisphaeraceae bacterium]